MSESINECEACNNNSVVLFVWTWDNGIEERLCDSCWHKRYKVYLNARERNEDKDE